VKSFCNSLLFRFAYFDVVVVFAVPFGILNMASVLFENGNECLSVYLFVCLFVRFARLLLMLMLSSATSTTQNEVKQLLCRVLCQRKRHLMC